MSILKSIKNWFSGLNKNQQYIPVKYLNSFNKNYIFDGNEEEKSGYKVEIDDLFSDSFKTAILVDTDAQSTFWFEWHDITAQHVRDLKNNYGLETYGITGSFTIFRTTKSKEEIETIRMLLDEHFAFFEKEDLNN